MEAHPRADWHIEDWEREIKCLNAQIDAAAAYDDEKDALIGRLLDSLSELVCLKDLKDKHGKTGAYLRRQPAAWDAARSILTTANARLTGPEPVSAKDRAPSDLELLRVALDGASKAVPVLFTILSKAGLREGAMVADEINANILTARKELGHLLEKDNG